QNRAEYSCGQSAYPSISSKALNPAGEVAAGARDARCCRLGSGMRLRSDSLDPGSVIAAILTFVAATPVAVTPVAATPVAVTPVAAVLGAADARLAEAKSFKAASLEAGSLMPVLWPRTSPAGVYTGLVGSVDVPSGWASSTRDSAALANWGDAGVACFG